MPLLSRPRTPGDVAIPFTYGREEGRTEVQRDNQPQTRMDYLLFITSLSLFGASMCFTPGPNNALAMATGMQKGFRAALPFCAGAAVGANISLLLLGFGLAEVFERFPLLYEGLRHAGALYMLWLAWRLSGLRLPAGVAGETVKSGAAGGVGEKENDTNVRENEFRRVGFWGALLLQLVNVKVWITNVVIVSRYMGSGDDALLKLAIAVALFTFLGGGAMCCWAAGGRFMGRFLTSGGMRRANCLFALFLVLSVGLLYI